MASFRRGSKKFPFPCISRFATSAFQCVTEPQPVYVCRPTPARPNAAGSSIAAVLPSGRNPLPSSPSSASNCPGPQRRQHRLHGRLVHLQQVGERRQVGRQRDDRADVEIAVRPAVQPLADAGRERIVDRRVAERALDADRLQPARCSTKNPVTPTTAFSFSSASVVFGSSRSTVPALMPAATSAGTASASTFRPTDSAVFGLTPGPTPPFALPAIAWCSFKVSPQNASSPNVSKRNVFRPFTIDCAAAATTSSPRERGRPRAARPCR